MTEADRQTIENALRIANKVRPKRVKQQKQYSKLMCDRSWRLLVTTAIACICGEGVLQWTGRGTMAAVVGIVMSLITFATVFINGGYITQNVFRDTSLNKNGIHLDGDDKHYIEKENSTI